MKCVHMCLNVAPQARSSILADVEKLAVPHPPDPDAMPHQDLLYLGVTTLLLLLDVMMSVQFEYAAPSRYATTSQRNLRFEQDASCLIGTL